MIDFYFAIQNPFKTRPWQDIYQGEWSVTKNRTLEIGLFRYNWNLFEVGLDLRWSGQSHAGPRFEIGILGYQFRIALIDNRHWDDEQHTWINYD